MSPNKIIRIIGKKLGHSDSQLIVDFDDPRVHTKISMSMVGDDGRTTAMISDVNGMKDLHRYLGMYLEKE